MNNHLFIYLSNNSINNPIILKEPLKLNGLKLVRYSINGVPTTNGIPNNLFLLLNFQDIPYQLDLNSNVNIGGIPLPLTGTFTSVELNHIIHLNPGNYQTIQQFSLTLKDSLGNYATFSNACFWFDIIF